MAVMLNGTRSTPVVVVADVAVAVTVVTVVSVAVAVVAVRVVDVPVAVVAVTDVAVTVVAVTDVIVVSVAVVVVGVVAVAVVVVAVVAVTVVAVVVTFVHVPALHVHPAPPAAHPSVQAAPSLMGARTQPKEASQYPAPKQSIAGSSSAQTRGVPGTHTARPLRTTQRAVPGTSHGADVHVSSRHGS